MLDLAWLLPIYKLLVFLLAKVIIEHIVKIKLLWYPFLMEVLQIVQMV